MEFLTNLFQYFIAINANAFNTIWYMLTKNWFILFSLIFIAVFIYFEIQMKNEDIIFDEREMY